MYRIIGLLLLGHLFSAALAVTTIHYYHNPSCNTGTDSGSYDAPTTPTSTDTQCHALYNQTRALYVNGLDSNCAGNNPFPLPPLPLILPCFVLPYLSKRPIIDNIH